MATNLYKLNTKTKTTNITPNISTHLCLERLLLDFSYLVRYFIHHCLELAPLGKREQAYGRDIHVSKDHEVELQGWKR